MKTLSLLRRLGLLVACSTLSAVAYSGCDAEVELKDGGGPNGKGDGVPPPEDCKASYLMCLNDGFTQEECEPLLDECGPEPACQKGEECEPPPCPVPCKEGDDCQPPPPPPCKEGEKCDPPPPPPPCKEGEKCDPLPPPPCKEGDDCQPPPPPPCKEGEKCDPPVPNECDLQLDACLQEGKDPAACKDQWAQCVGDPVPVPCKDGEDCLPPPPPCKEGDDCQPPPPNECDLQLDACLQEGKDPAACKDAWAQCIGEQPPPPPPPSCEEQLQWCLDQGIDPALCELKLEGCQDP